MKYQIGIHSSFGDMDIALHGDDGEVMHVLDIAAFGDQARVDRLVHLANLGLAAEAKERDAALARGRQMSQPPPEYFRHTEEAS